MALNARQLLMRWWSAVDEGAIPRVDVDLYWETAEALGYKRCVDCSGCGGCGLCSTCEDCEEAGWDSLNGCLPCAGRGVLEEPSAEPFPGRAEAALALAEQALDVVCPPAGRAS